MDQRVKTSSGNIQQTVYKAGQQLCDDLGHGPNSNDLSQWGSKARAESDSSACGGNETWEELDEYYYTGTVGSGSKPAAPDKSWSRVSGGRLKFEFDSVGGYRYNLQRSDPCPGGEGGCWKVEHNKGWSCRSRNIPKSFTFDPGGNCYQYRVKAINPVGRVHLRQLRGWRSNMSVTLAVRGSCKRSTEP